MNMKRKYRTPRQRRIAETRKQAALLWLVALPFIIMLGYVNYVDYSAQVCRDVPNHYSCQR